MNISTKDLNKRILSLQVANTQLIYNNNLKVLQKSDRKLYEKVLSFEGTEDYITVKKDTNTLSNMVCFDKNIVFYDMDEPLKIIEENYNELNCKNIKLAVFLGISLGYELMYFCDLMANKQGTQYILVVEKDMNIFKKFLQTTDISYILNHPKIKFIIGEDIDNLFVILRDYMREDSKFLFLKAMDIINISGSYKINRDYYINFFSKLKEAGIFQLSAYGDDPEDSLIGVKNILSNISEIISNSGINMLYNKFKDRPAVVVSTGPSLNKNKHLLKELEEKALIIAPEASLKVLLSIGVKPHIITSLERVPAVVQLIEGVKKEEVEEVYLAACPVVVKEVYESYPGPRLIVYRKFDTFKWINIDKGMLEIKQSAGNMAFKVADALGCSPIILIGQDLAFGDDGATHAKGSIYNDDDEDKKKSAQNQYRKNGIFEVKGNVKENVLTNKVWYSFLKGYELDITNAKCKCINATEGGAYIQGTEVMTFKEAIDKYITEKFYPINIIKDKLSMFAEQEVSQDIKKVLNIIDATIIDMSKIIDLYNEGLSILKKYEHELKEYLNGNRKPSENRIKKISNDVYKNKLNALNNYQNTHQLFFMHIIQSFDIKFNIDILAIPSKYDNKLLADIEILLWQFKWYNINIRIGEISLEELQKAKDQLENLRD